MSSNIKNVKQNIATQQGNLVAVLSPATAQSTAGTAVEFSSYGSGSILNQDLKYEWELRTPVGSDAIVVNYQETSPYGLKLSEDLQTARLFPDINGIYEIILTVSLSTGEVATATSFLFVTSVDRPLDRTKPSSEFIGNNISDFWRFIEGREAISSLWSEYISVIANDYRKVGELVLSKAINSIQSGRVQSNVSVHTDVSLRNADTSIKFSDSFYGTSTAHTSLYAIQMKAIAISAAELLVIKGTPSSANAGTTVEVYDANLGGTYFVNKVKKGRVYLSKQSILPASSRSDIVTGFALIGGSSLAFTTAASSIQKGQFIRIGEDYIEVIDTFSTDPTLPASNYIKLNKKFLVSKSNLTVSVFNTVSISVIPVRGELTNIVYVPAEDVGGDGFFSDIVVTDINAIPIGPYTIQIPTHTILNKHKLLAGKIEITTTDLARFKASILSARKLSVDNVDYINFDVYPAIPLTEFNPDNPVNVKVSIKSTNRAKDLLITVDDISCSISKVEYVEDISGNTLAAIYVDENVFLSDKVGMNWRICNTMTCASMDSFPKEGVVSGDILRVEVSSSYNTARTYIDCTVVGSYKDKVSFEITTEELVNTENPVESSDPAIGELLPPRINKTVLARMIQHLQIPSAGILREDIEFLHLASVLYKNIAKTTQITKYLTVKGATFNIDDSSLDNTIYVTSGLIKNTILRLSVLPTFIRRLTMIPLEADLPVASIPYITEFVYPKETSEVEGSSKVAILAEDGTIFTRNRVEIELFENTQFMVMNDLAFTGVGLNKNSDSMNITAASGMFLDRGTKPGDLLVCDGTTYYIKNVVNNTTLELAENFNGSVLSVQKSNASYLIQKPHYKTNYSYLVFRPGVFSITSPTPTTLFLPVTVLDNSYQIEDNFGCLVGYYLSNFIDFSTPQITYASAVKALTYALTTGPTLHAVKVAASVLLNIPVSEDRCVIDYIDKSMGKIVLKGLSRQDTETGVQYVYSFSTKESHSKFKAIATHPDVYREYQIGDIVEPFTTICDKIIVSDYIKSPEDFVGLPLRKYHSWLIEIDAHSVDSRDIPLLRDFYDNIKPIYTKPMITLVLYLVDVVAAIDFLLINGALRLYDDPAFGLELTHMYDNTNNSRQILRLSDNGELSTRTLFFGQDLVVSSSTRVSSARGGFMLNDAAQFSTSTDPVIRPDTKVLPSYKPFYKTSDANSQYFHVRGKFLVKSGDILYIYSGINAGVYSVTSVVSDTELDIQPLSGYLPYTTIPSVDTSEVNFGLYRKVTSIISSNLQTSAVSGNTITFTDTALNWDGVSVGDILVNEADFEDTYEILDIEYDPTTEDAALTLTVDQSTTSIPTSASFLIYRDALEPKEYAEALVTSYDFVNSPRKLTHDFNDTYKIAVGDSIELLDGTYQGTILDIIKVVGSSIFLSGTIGNGTVVGTAFKLTKNLRPKLDNSDKRLEFLHGYDDVSIELASVAANAIPGGLTTVDGLDGRPITIIPLNTVLYPGDRLQLFVSSTLVYEGLIAHTISVGAMCYDTFVDSSLQTALHFYKIIRRSRP